MAPDYSVRWWKERQLTPPELDPVSFIAKRIEWRYVHGKPETGGARVFLNDSTKMLPRLTRDTREGRRPKFKLLMTSPPYHNVTNYYYDQWIRLWLLGGPENPKTNGNRYGGKFSDQARYRRLLKQVFLESKQTLDEGAILYVRTDCRKSTLDATIGVLGEVFPESKISRESRPLGPAQQAKPYGRGGAPKRPNCEVDLILLPR